MPGQFAALRYAQVRVQGQCAAVSAHLAIYAAVEALRSKSLCQAACTNCAPTKLCVWI